MTTTTVEKDLTEETFKLAATDGAVILRENGSIEVANPGGNNPPVAVAINLVCNLLGVSQRKAAAEADDVIVE